MFYQWVWAIGHQIFTEDFASIFTEEHQIFTEDFAYARWTNYSHVRIVSYNFNRLENGEILFHGKLLACNISIYS